MLMMMGHADGSGCLLGCNAVVRSEPPGFLLCALPALRRVGGIVVDGAAAAAAGRLRLCQRGKRRRGGAAEKGKNKVLGIEGEARVGGRHAHGAYDVVFSPPSCLPGPASCVLRAFRCCCFSRPEKYSMRMGNTAMDDSHPTPPPLSRVLWQMHSRPYPSLSLGLPHGSSMRKADGRKGGGDDDDDNGGDQWLA